MINKRTSIKGIGSSIFYDSVVPDHDPARDDDEVAEAIDREVTLQETIPARPRETYDFEDSESAAGDQSGDGEDEERWKVVLRETAVEEDEVPWRTDDDPSWPIQERLFEASAIEAARTGEERIRTGEPSADVVSESGESAPEGEPVITGENVDALGLEAMPSEDGNQSSSVAMPIMPTDPIESRQPGFNDQPDGDDLSELDNRLGDLKAVSPEQEEQAQKRLGEQAIKDLLLEVDVLYERITASLSTRPDLARRSMDLLSEARDLLLLGNAGDYNLAERRVNEARATLNQVELTRRWGNTYGWGLFSYEVILFVAFVVALLFDQHIAEWISLMTGTYTVTDGVAQLTQSMALIFPPWNTMLWGGIGGVVGALYSLHWHVAELQDFDRQYSLWYVVQPLMGVILGGIIHLVIVTGLLALVPVGSRAVDTAVATQWFPALVACLAGFRQKFTYELLDSIMRAFGRQPAGSLRA